MNRSRKGLMIQISKWEQLQRPREELAHDAELQFQFAKQTSVGVDEAWDEMQSKKRALYNVNAVIQRGRDILALFDDVERKHHTSGVEKIRGYGGIKSERVLQSLPRTPGAARRKQITTLGEVRTQYTNNIKILIFYLYYLGHMYSTF